jgi:protein ImuB
MPTAELRDAKGFPVAVTARLELTGLPATLVVVGQKPRPVRAWAGPWPVDERWWDQNSAHRQARFQVVVATSSETGISLSEVDSQIAVDSQIEVAAGGRGGLEYEGTGLLLVLEGGQWSVEAVYD